MFLPEIRAILHLKIWEILDSKICEILFKMYMFFLSEIREILLHNFNVFTGNSRHFAPKNS